jgi:hypothetical protein
MTEIEEAKARLLAEVKFQSGIVGGNYEHAADIFALLAHLDRLEALSTPADDPKPVEFVDLDGTPGVLVWDPGDMSVGLFPGYTFEGVIAPEPEVHLVTFTDPPDRPDESPEDDPAPSAIPEAREP